MSLPADLPDRLGRALAAWDRLAGEGLVLAGVRHHSPACSAAVVAAMDELTPGTVLIEGPQEYDGVLPALADDRTVPPVAVLSGMQGSDAGMSVYPLAEFSPEWQALRRGSRSGARVRFIDLAYGSRPPADERTRTLQAERYLAHSRSLQRMAEGLGCRDHDELWEALFEIKATEQLRDWRATFRQTLVWAGLARLDYEAEVLESGGNLDREATMLERIEGERSRADGPVVVVTGAFHTLALLEALTGAADGEPVRSRRPPAALPGDAWLIRYDHRRLDGLRGYGAGMPSPGFQHRLWQIHQQRADPGGLAAEVLADIAATANEPGSGRRISTPELVEASLHARRLADLREHPWPGRTDVLDAMTSCFVKTEGVASPELRDAIAGVLADTVLGEVPAGSASPPIVADTRERARRLGLKVADSSSKVTAVRPGGSTAQLRRSRFLALTSFLGIGFAQRLTAPALGRNRRATEKWRYAWTPQVEAALIGLLDEGATLDAVARGRLRVAAGDLADSRSAAGAAQLLSDAAAIGQPEAAGDLVPALRSAINHDPDAADLARAGHRLLDLPGQQDDPGLPASWDAAIEVLLDQLLHAAAYLVPDLARVSEEAEPAAIATCLSLAGLARRLPAPPGAWSGRDALRTALLALADDPTAATGVRGCLVARSLVDGDRDDAAFGEALAVQLGVGAAPENAVRFFSGVMAAAPDLLLHSPDLLPRFDAVLTTMSEDRFRALLPDLRRALAGLRPRETARLAEVVAAGLGEHAGLLSDLQSPATEADLAVAQHLEARLRAVLRADPATIALVPGGPG